MARRELQEINAGSMADIAFLLLIFWLVTTTIDSDEGVKRQLPPPVPPDMENPPPVRERNVFVVLVNANDDLLVEGEELDISRLKDEAKEFLIATGDGLLHGDKPEDPDLPVREWVRKSAVQQKIAEYKAGVESTDDPDTKKAFQKKLDDWNDKLVAIELLGGEFKTLPGSALISMRNDRNTTYETYLSVQNELEAAINELRDELALAKFGMTYAELEDKYERNPDELTRQRIFAIREVYPQRISEAEPQDAGAVYN